MSAASSFGTGNPCSGSTIVAGNAAGYHEFKIDGYSRIKNLPNGQSLKSSPFTVGGRRWRIDFFPNGDVEATFVSHALSAFFAGHLGEQNLMKAGYASVYLVLDEDVTEPVMAQYEFAFMVEKRTPFFRKRMGKVSCGKKAIVNSFDSGDASGFRNFLQRSTLERRSGAIKNDSLTIRCDVVVFNEIRATAETAAPTTFVPPSDLIRHLGDLLQTGKGADVVFQVGSETFAAHRWLLASRSPVFSAEFFGTMQESTTTTGGGVVHVDDIVAPVFRALLCFLYTDSLPEIRKEDEVVMYQHLLVAADRYSVERLKLICEDKLFKNIDVPKVATILALAEQHNCIVLKKLCLDFLSAPANLKAAMATDGFKHLSTSCPSIKKDLDAILAS